MSQAVSNKGQILFTAGEQARNFTLKGNTFTRETDGDINGFRQFMECATGAIGHLAYGKVTLSPKGRKLKVEKHPEAAAEVLIGTYGLTKNSRR